MIDGLQFFAFGFPERSCGRVSFGGGHSKETRSGEGFGVLWCWVALWLNMKAKFNLLYSKIQQPNGKYRVLRQF
jgi:hypothetical protein